MASRNPNNHPLRIFANAKADNKVVCVAGPMVRYSKLPFRQTLRDLSPENTIVYTPMILAREFVRAQFARDSDFTTNESDSPLIVQFGASNPTDLARAARMIQPYCDGIGLNCGCPIKEQNREGIGAALMLEPERVAEMVRAVKETCGSAFCVEVKMRIHTDLKQTVKWAKIVEASGVDYLTVHGRRKQDRSSQPANFEAIKLVKEAVNCPVVANGDCFSPDDVSEIAAKTGADGVMSVRGILANPALFGGYDETPWKAIELFWDYAMSYGLPFQLIQHHIYEMTSSELTRRQRKGIHECESTVDLIDWFDTHFDLKRRGEDGFASRDVWPWRRQLELTDSVAKLSLYT